MAGAGHHRGTVYTLALTTLLGGVHLQFFPEWMVGHFFLYMYMCDACQEVLCYLYVGMVMG